MINGKFSRAIAKDDVAIHEEPNFQSDIIGQLPYFRRLMVDLDASTKDFYKIYTETSIEGYCLKEFIEVL